MRLQSLTRRPERLGRGLTIDRDDPVRAIGNALRIANGSTGPKPRTATVSSSPMGAFPAPMHSVGRASERNGTSSPVPSGTVTGPTSVPTSVNDTRT